MNTKMNPAVSRTNIIENATLKRDTIQLLSQGTERPSVDRMGMRRTQNIRPSCVNGAMNQKSSFIKNFDFAMIKNGPMVIDSEQIALVNSVEIDSEWVDPECFWLDWISHGDVAGQTFVQAIVPEDPISSSQPAFDVVAFFVFVVELELWRREEANVISGRLRILVCFIGGAFGYGERNCGLGGLCEGLCCHGEGKSF